MKKITLIIILITTTLSLFAQTQDSKGIQKVTFGAVYAVSANTVLEKEIKPFTLGHNLSLNLCVVTRKTYHNFLYGFGNNAVRMVNGYLFKKDLGLYTIFSENLGSRGSYVSVGVEQVVKAGDINFFLFAEVGTKINPVTKLVTLGFHANIQKPLWRRNK